MRRKSGFTLIEMLIVIAILIILMTLVISVFTSNQGTDRMRAAARQLQSSILGARDRAIHAKANRGVRLILDSADLSTVTSYIYISALDPHAPAADQITIGRPNLDNTGNADDPPMGMQPAEDVVRTVRRTGAGTVWNDFKNLQLLVNGSRIRIPANGSWYTVDISRLTATSEILTLNSDFRGSGGTAWPIVVDQTFPNYILELEAAPTRGEQPISLPSACVIDLDNSRLPGRWWTGAVYRDDMDIMFSPRGTVTGPLAATGIIHFLLAETGDTTFKIAGDAATAQSSSLHKSRATARTIPPESTQGEKMIVTLFTRTGAVSTHQVDVISSLGPDGLAGTALTDDDGDGITDADTNTTNLPDPEEIGYGDDAPRQRFKFAETGLSAGK